MKKTKKKRERMVGLAYFVLLLLVLGSLPALAAYPLEQVGAETDLLELAAAKVEMDSSLFHLKTPKGYFATRYPSLERVSYELDFFADLYEDPLMVYPFTQMMAKAAAQYFHDDYRETDLLYYMLYYFGVDKLGSGTFRGYLSMTGLEHPPLPEDEPLIYALDQLYHAMDEKTLNWSFGGYGSESPRYQLQEEIEKVPVSLRVPLARYLMQIVNTYEWYQLGVRNVEPELLREVYQTRDLHLTVGNATKVYPHIMDVEARLDKTAFYRAAQIITLATGETLTELETILAETADNFDFETAEFVTPLGRIVISGKGDDTHEYRDLLLLIDLGGDDLYHGMIGANTSAVQPISVAMDFGGNDKYENSDPQLSSQGAGIMGYGILADLAGDDTYVGDSCGQGFGLFGTGILYDREGKDTYTHRYAGQGAGYFGIGLNLDQKGDDSYNIKGLGLGHGGPGGIGAVVNNSGNDTYTAERYLDQSNADEESRPINNNNVMGSGYGRRGDVEDGYAWAGGLGVMMDMTGDDVYTSGGYSIGIGYWFGTGICYDRSGNDIYNGTSNSQGADVHFSIGALIDDHGDDQHNVYDSKYTNFSGFGLGMGYDGGAGILINRYGNDEYRSRGSSFGFSNTSGSGFFIDAQGDDRYLSNFRLDLGYARPQEYAKTPNLRFIYYYKEMNTNVGLFIDGAGDDEYLEWNITSGNTKDVYLYKDNSYWLGTPLSEAKEMNLYGIGLDINDGSIPYLELLDGWNE